jgi:hypothetical protein
LEPPNLVFDEFWSQATVFSVMVEDVVDGDEHLAGDCDEGSVVSSAFRDSHVELAESWVVACVELVGFDLRLSDHTCLLGVGEYGVDVFVFEAVVDGDPEVAC